MSEPRYYVTNTGLYVESPIRIISGKDVSYKELLVMQKESPDALISVKYLSGRRGGVSRQKISVKNLTGVVL